MSRVLLTGATGFVGGRLADRLRQRGDDVIAVVRTPSEGLAAIGVDQREGGLPAADRAAVADVEVVVHAAAAFGDDASVSREVNRDATGELATHAAAAGRPFVHVSTTSVYDLDAAGDVVDEHTPLRSAETTPPATTSSPALYALTKAEGEARIAQIVDDTGLTATVLRPPAVLGAGPTSTWGTSIPRSLREGGWSPPHPDTTFTWVHVDDLVDVIVAAIDRPTTATCNVIGGSTTFGTYLEALHRAIPSVPAPPPVDAEARRWTGKVDGSHLPEVFGIVPSRTFDEAIDEIGAWWRDHDER